MWSTGIDWTQVTEPESSYHWYRCQYLKALEFEIPTEKSEQHLRSYRTAEKAWTESAKKILSASGVKDEDVEMILRGGGGSNSRTQNLARKETDLELEWDIRQAAREAIDRIALSDSQPRKQSASTSSSPRSQPAVE
jgi:hypothetical protein